MSFSLGEEDIARVEEEVLGVVSGIRPVEALRRRRDEVELVKSELSLESDISIA